MTKEQFYQTLREFRWREPPQPFVVERVDGGLIEIDDPQAVAFSENAAVFLSPAFEFIEFSSDTVRAIRAAHQEQAS